MARNPLRFSDEAGTRRPSDAIHTVKIRLNGEPHELAGPRTVTALLSELGIDARRVAVERNEIVVKRAAYDSTVVEENDEIEVVNFVGGG